MIGVEKIYFIFNDGGSLAMQNQADLAFAFRLFDVFGLVDDQRVIALAYIAVPSTNHRKAAASVPAGTGDGRSNRGGAAFAIPIEILVNTRERTSRVDDNGVRVELGRVHSVALSLLTFELPGT